MLLMALSLLRLPDLAKELCQSPIVHTLLMRQGLFFIISLPSPMTVARDVKILFVKCCSRIDKILKVCVMFY
jgi:hypothetical protein